MSHKVDTTKTEDRPPCEPVEVRDSTPEIATNMTSIDEEWTMLDLIDDNNLSTEEADSNSDTTLDKIIEEDEEYTLDASINPKEGNTLMEYTFSAPLDVQDPENSLSETHNTDLREAVEEAEYTAYLPDAPPEQYSPDVFIQARQKSGRIIGSNINLPYEIEGVITAPSPPTPGSV